MKSSLGLHKQALFLYSTILMIFSEFLEKLLQIPEVRILMQNQKGFCPMLYYALYRFAELE